MEVVLGACATTIIDAISKTVTDDVATASRFVTKFRTVIHDYHEGKSSLESILRRVQHDVVQSHNNAEEIEEDVRDWIINVEREMRESLDLDQTLMRLRRRNHGTDDDDEDNHNINNNNNDTSRGSMRTPNMVKKYKLGKKAAKFTDAMAKLREESKFVRVGGRAAFTGREFLSCNDYVAFASTERAFDKTEEALRSVRLVGVYGMGGVGKTTLAKEVGARLLTDAGVGLFDKVVMATVSQTPSFRSIQDQIAEMLGLKMDPETQPQRASLLNRRLTKKDERVLVILDDVWEAFDLALIGIPTDQDSCKVIVTTRIEDVCNSMRCNSKVPLDVLPEGDAWNLLKDNASIDDADTDLVKVARKMTRRCQGLPLALVTVGKAMRDKTLKEWKFALKELKRSSSLSVPITGVDTAVYASIRLSYDHLSSYDIKMCFLLCSLFPEDHSISVEELCLYAMGLGLYEDEATIEDARCTINKVFRYLKNCCLLLGTNIEGVVKMHDVVRDVALWISKKGDHSFYVEAAKKLEKWPALRQNAQYEAISLLDNKLNKLTNDNLKYPKLRILLLGKNKDAIQFPDSFFERKQGLTVLDVTYKYRLWEVPLVLPTSLKHLTLLHGLYLRHCKLDDISTLGSLGNLEILSIRDSYLVRFPNEIGELEGKLRMLDMSGCQVGTMCAKALGRLTRLQELYLGGTTFNNWEVEGTSAQGSSAWLSQLDSLYFLSIFSLNLDHLQCIPHDFAFQKLLRYDISMNNSSKEHPESRTLDVKDLNPSSLTAFRNLLKSVEYLSMQNLNEGIQNMVPSAHPESFVKLFRLKLESCCHMQSLSWVKDRPNHPVLSKLCELYIHKMDGFRAICLGEVPRGFLCALRVLVVTHSNELVVVLPHQVMQGVTRLEKVTVEECGKVKQVFEMEQEGDHLKELRNLELKRLPELLYIWRWSIRQGFISLANLTSIEVIRCDKLIYIFLPRFAATLAQLQLLKVKLCNNLEQIVHKDEEDDTMSRNIPQYFPKLQKLCVKGCNKLTTLFLVRPSESLPQLRVVEVTKAAKLTSVFEVERESSERGETIEVPQLLELKLKELPKLECFAAGGRHFTMPRLTDLTLRKCPNTIQTSFSVSPDFSTVHVRHDHRATADGGVVMDSDRFIWNRHLSPDKLPIFSG